MKTLQSPINYKGTRTDSCTDLSVQKNGIAFDPKPSQELWNHSPDGFNWGYGGSGPAQLALALLQDAADDDVAKRFHQRFKADVVANFEDTWEYSSTDAQEWLQENVHDESTC